MSWQWDSSLTSPGTRTAFLPASLPRAPSPGRRLFFLEVGDQDVRALAGEGKGDGPTDTRVAAGYDRLLPSSLPEPR